MLSRDPCLVQRLRSDSSPYQQAVAKLLGLPVQQIRVEPPMVESDPAGASPDGPAKEVNRPWIAFWGITILPPSEPSLPGLFIEAINAPLSGSKLPGLLPLTLARVPGMPDPQFSGSGTREAEVRLPAPSAATLALGTPRPGCQGAEDIAKLEIEEGLKVKDTIRRGQERLEQAAERYQEALNVEPRVPAPEIMPPSLASAGAGASLIELRRLRRRAPLRTRQVLLRLRPQVLAT